MAKSVTLEEVWERLVPYRDLCSRSQNAKIYEAESGTPFDQEELEQFKDLVMIHYAQKPEANPYQTANYLKQFWPNRSKLSLASRVFDFLSADQCELEKLKTMSQQYDTLENLDVILHGNQLLAVDEVVFSSSLN